MTTMAENERLATLETQYGALQKDVTEIKSDVKGLVTQQAVLATAIAVRNAADLAASQKSSSVGVWVRSVVPWVLMGTGLFLTILNTFDLTLQVAK